MLRLTASRVCLNNFTKDPSQPNIRPDINEHISKWSLYMPNKIWNLHWQLCIPKIEYNNKIETAKSVKPLAVDIDHQLKFSKHTSALCFKTVYRLNEKGSKA